MSNFRIVDFFDGFTSETEPSIQNVGSYTVIGPLTISDGGTIANASDNLQIIKITGDGGVVTVAAALFDTSVDDGAVIKLVGQSNTNTVTINHNDVAGGTILNGDVTLGQNDSIELIYDSSLDRYIEQSRNS